MSRLKKVKQMQQIYQQNKVQIEEIDRYEQQQSYKLFPQNDKKKTNISMLQKNNNDQKKKKRIIKNKKSKFTINNHSSTSIISNPSTYHYQQSFNHPQKLTISNCKNISDKKILTLQVNDDIKAYYELLDLTESLDALIIKYYKDPLLSTILMDSNIDAKTNQEELEGETTQKQKQSKKEKVSSIKSEVNHHLYDRKMENVKIKLQPNQQQLSQVYQSDSESSKNEEQYQNEENSWNSSSLAEFNVKGKQEIQPKIEQLSLNVQKNIQRMQKNEVIQFHQQKSQMDELKLSDSQNEQQQQFAIENKDESIKDPKLSELHNWLKEIAIFIDKFSQQQFKKLFKLKQLLNLILISVNKSVKKQLDQFYKELQNKLKNNNNNQLNNNHYQNQKKQDIFLDNYHQIKFDQYNNNNLISSNQDDHHVCRICWQYFVNGHQLGGHMSKKHPGHSLEYRNKQLIKTRKVIERQRRLYFRMIRNSVKQSKVFKEQKKTKLEN